MKKTPSFFSIALVFVVALPLRAPAQSLAEAAKKGQETTAAKTASKKVYTNKDLDSRTTAAAKDEEPSGPDALIDRTKFDKVYTAGKAVDSAKFMSAVGVTSFGFRQLLLTLQTETSVALDKSTTKAEKALAGKYTLAAAQFNLALQYWNRPSYYASERTSALDKAKATLDSANKIYLDKK